MKQFLYLDTDIVNSIVAQAEKGLIENFTEEKNKTQSNNSKENKKIEGNVNVNSPFLKFLTIGGNIGGGKSSEENTYKSLAYNQLVTKVLHDAAFDKAIEQIKLVTDKTTNMDVGTYFRIEETFSFVDLKYLHMLFSDNDFKGIIKESYRLEAEEKVNQMESVSNREERRAKKFDRNAEIDRLMKEYADNIIKVLSILNSIIPYERILMSQDGYIIPLEDKYFRVDPVHLGFKYGGKISCVGMVTNVIGDEDRESDMFSTLQASINDIVRSLLSMEKNTVYIVHPIALYYENQDANNYE